MSEEVAARIVALCLERIKAAASDGSFVSAARPYRLMFFWRHASPGGAQEVRTWTDTALTDRAFVIAMADATTSVAWTHSIGYDGNGDRVSRPSVRVDFEHYRDMLDCDRLERRVDEVIASGDLTDAERQIIDRFKSAPRGSHMRNSED